MNDDRWWVPFAGAFVYILLRAVDYLMPTGRHWRFIERYSRRDDPRRSSRRDDDCDHPHSDNDR